MGSRSKNGFRFLTSPKLNEAATLLHWNIKEAHVFCQECSFEEEEVCFLTIELVLMLG